MPLRHKSTAEIQIREITGTEFVALTFRLRFEVWREETDLTNEVLSKGLITDGHDDHARHWAAFNELKMVAAARMCIHDGQEESPDAPAFSKIRLPAPVATINRLVVAPLARKFGLARQLDERRIFAARSDGAKCIVGTAAPARIAPLTRLGFRVTGEQWIQYYCKSIVMEGMVLML
jgi:predicted GNAT family N-acyltransferase